MTIKHVLKNGEVLNDITGHVVKREENQQIYSILGSFEKMGLKKNNLAKMKCNS